MQRLFGSEISNFAFYFRDYIAQKYQVPLEVKEEQTKYGIMLAVYVAEDCPLLSQIEQERDEFLKRPFDAMYQQASWETGKIEQTDENKVRWKFPQFSQWKQQKFTVFLTALCLIIYLFQLLGFNQEILLATHYPEGYIEQSELWRYFTHSLVHLSPWHITFNLVWWWIFAGKIEQKFGTATLVLLYLLSAFISGFAQNIASGPAFFGLSGVVYAVLGYVLVFDKFSRLHPFHLPQGFFTMLLVGIAFGFVSPLIGVSMGNTAHITGLLSGIVLAGVKILFTKPQKTI
ncbi:rhomboid family intramembrane serine protease [Avibacterium sp. 21-586]|uniref:rhomboid family intramembrane serine protease n=1 Tax=Avibacterium sp. 21-586 TaxID=2911534 RepID=UPI002246F86F|nr:rhomboid family intramembrane serine protease [Avibacterium sp. 21-586]MCW9711267.1 rhomboid family intramembrane serine protease [Avibacterium sp. 21-586]